MFTAPLFALRGYKASQSYRKALSLAYVRYSDVAELSSGQKVMLGGECHVAVHVAQDLRLAQRNSNNNQRL